MILDQFQDIQGHSGWEIGQIVEKWPKWLKFDQFPTLKAPEYPKTDLKSCSYVYFKYM